jgi:hypothetical protein
MSAAPETSTPDDPAHAPQCPRCGYDQQGTLASWHADPAADNAACPLTGMCSECGLAFEWPDLLIPERTICPGLFDHAPGLNSAAKTMLWILVPWMFWSRVRMHHQFHLRRAVAFPLLVIAAGFVLERLLILLLRLADFANSPGLTLNRSGLLDFVTARPLSVSESLLFPFFVSFGQEIQPGPGLLIWFIVIAANLIWLVLLLLLSDSRKQSRVSTRHILRGWAYSLWPIALSASLMTLAIMLDFLAFANVVSPLNDVLRITSWGLAVASGIGAVATWLHGMVWWSCAIIRGWQMRQGWLVAGVLSFVAFLATLTASGVVGMLAN